MAPHRPTFRRFPALAPVLALALGVLPASPARAAHDEKDIPYWGTLRTEPANMRVGPGEDYRINWVYHRVHLPVKVLRAMEGWRLVEDPDGARGWVLARFISKERSGFVVGDAAEMREAPDAAARLLWRLGRGVTAKLGDCADGWCRVELGGHGGYVRESALWGTTPLK